MITPAQFQKIEALLAVRQYALYWPDDRNDLLMQFPDLQKIPAISALHPRPKDLIFVWFFGCKSSPAMRLHGDQARRRLAAIAAFGDPIPKEYMSYVNGHFPKDVADALAAMRSFEPGPEVRMRLLYERMIENAIALVDVDVSTLPTDWAERHKYLQTVEKSMEIVSRGKNGIEGLQGIVLRAGDGPDEREGEAFARINNLPNPQL